MSIQYQKISGDSATELVFNYALDSNTSSIMSNNYSEDVNKNVKLIFNREYRLTNIHASDDVTVDLYVSYLSGSTNLSGNDVTPITETTSDIYYLKKIKLPLGATLVLEKGDLIYPLKYNQASTTLYIKLNAADSAVDVITIDY